MWFDRVVETPDNITKGILPYNEVTKTLFYNTRIIISVPLLQPLAWRVSKVEPFTHRGNLLYTFKEDTFDQNHDYLEKDIDGNIIGYYADYFKENNLPTIEEDDPEVLPQELEGNYAEITYAGSDPLIKINGSYKRISIAYYNSGELIKDQTPGDWSYLIDDTDASDLIKVLETDTPNTIKVKFLGDEGYTGKILTIKNTRDDIVAELQLQIIVL